MKKLLIVLSKGTLPFIIAFSALSVSASAAFYSVSGLSKLFAGASFEVIIMAGSLEIAKLVTASLLYQYWDKINKILRTYLTIATIILVLVTSMGIYGFLSAAYQETYQKLSINENRIEFLDQKREFYQQDVTRYDNELARISGNISTLSNARATSIQVRDTTSSTGVRNTISTAELRLAQSRIEVEEKNRNDVQARREIAADSLQKYQLEILDLENNTEITGELGPLQYLSGLTGTPMDKIINWLLLVIIFVFDPLAISLVVAANFAFAQAFPKKEEEIDDYDEDWDIEESFNTELIEDIEVNEPEEVIEEKEDLSNWDIEEVEEKNRNDVQARREIAADSLQKYQLEILDLENNTEITGELGPLQYLSGLTGTPMDKIINWLLLVIIFVFDPLAISLVVAANFAFAQAFPKKEEEIDDYDEDWDIEESFNTELIEDIEVNEPEEVIEEKEDLSNWDIEEVEKRMDIIGQNGNEGLHYDDTEIKEYISTAEDKIMAATKSIMEKQKVEDNKLKNKLDAANEEINELDKANVKIIDSIKHINDYLKKHAPYYNNQGIALDNIKLGFAEEDDYIEDNDIKTY